MARVWDYFVILAGMRTGSNFLEASLNEFPGLHGHGELFNPHFVGGRNDSSKFGLTLSQREADPLAMLEAMRASKPGLHGFRLFHDHDARVLEHCLEDRKCAKIVLTRNPLESYVSREIARKTDQWRLNDLKHAKSARIRFEEAGFERHLQEVQRFLRLIRRGLQTAGQAAFEIGYDDLSDIGIINGLARYLGVNAARKQASNRTKKQNPQPLKQKVENFDEMKASMARLDLLGLDAQAYFEPERSAMVGRYIAAAKAPVLYMPVPCGPDESIWQWLANLDGVPREELQSGFSQKTLRQWKRRAGPHETFSVVRHPVARLHRCFTRHFLTPGPDHFSEVAAILRRSYDVALPDNPGAAFRTIPAHRAAFIAFARFVQGNLNGQTSVRVDGAWATQSSVISGMARFMAPNHILKEEDMETGLDHIARKAGLQPVSYLVEQDEALAEIYDADVEAAVRAAYQRDYMMFGFGRWKAAS